jgi:hypothetical protein
MALSIAELQSELAAGVTPDDFDSLALQVAVPGARPYHLDPPSPSTQVVPEPTVLVLMLLGIPLLMVRKRYARSN